VFILEGTPTSGASAIGFVATILESVLVPAEFMAKILALYDTPFFNPVNVAEVEVLKFG